MAKNSKDQSFEQAVNTEVIAKKLGVDESLIIDDLNMTPLEREQNPYTKSDLSDVKTVLTTEGGQHIDYTRSGETKEIAGCTITARDEEYTEGVLAWKKTKTKQIYHVESDYLGSFDYDPEEFTLGYKKLEDGSRLPVLTYIGTNDGAKNILGPKGDSLVNVVGVSDIIIPDGIKNIDYMFTDDKNLKFIPKIPGSVDSMHYTFSGCSNAELSVDFAYNGWDYSKDKSGFAGLNLLNLATVGCDSCVYLPERLKDVSGAFEGCSALKCIFSTYSQRERNINGVTVVDSKLPETVINAQNAWDGCNNLDAVKNGFLKSAYAYTKYPQYGKDITPYLTSTYAKDALNVSSEEIKDYADNVDFTVNEKGQVASDVDTTNLDQQALQEAQAATRIDTLRKVFEGSVEADTEVASGGARSNNYYYDATDNDIHDDVSGLIKGDDAPSSMSVLWQRAIVDGTTGLGIGLAAGKLTDSKIVGLVAGVGAAIGLDYLDILPESLVPIGYWVADKLPDGEIKTKLTEFCQSIAPSSISDQEDLVTAENKAATYQNRRLQRSVFAVEAGGELKDLTKALYNNAEYCGKNLNFKATADKAVASGEAEATDGARAVIHSSVASFNEFINSEAESGRDVAEIQTLLKDYYVDLMEGLDSYNDGARHGISQLLNSTYKDVSYQGLEMLNRAYADETLTALKAMDTEYHFMDDEAWSKIEALNITGIDIRNARNFESENLKALSEKSIAETTNIIAEAGDDYNVGAVVTTHDNESFWNSGSGRFYNEEMSDNEVSENHLKESIEKAVGPVAETEKADDADKTAKRASEANIVEDSSETDFSEYAVET